MLHCSHNNRNKHNYIFCSVVLITKTGTIKPGYT